jgi:D-tyrosyl-tRNA(Tyr) deacylase
MRAVIQRVLRAQVTVDGRTTGQIEKGILAYVSIAKSDTEKDAEFMADKLVNLRIFPDEADKMNRRLLDVGGAILLVSNFTLHGDCRKGRRPGFDAAAEPKSANQLYEKLIQLVAARGIAVEKGIFGASMQVASVNDGPVTFILDTA